jgi:hypothetical protein
VVGSEAGSEGRRSVSETKRTGHTPGPWTTYHGRATPWWKVLAEGRDVADVEGGEITVYNDPNHPEAVEANARLIAAAPDLLAALKAVHARRIAWPAEIEAAVGAALLKAEAPRE